VLKASGVRQVKVRAWQQVTGVEADDGTNYRDYVLATGQTHAVLEVVA